MFWFSLLQTFVLFTIIDGIFIARNPDSDRNVTELILSRGYSVEEHDVVTKDGYIINIQRMPCRKKIGFCDTTRKPIVLLHHGIFENSEIWVLNGPKQSLGYILADAGYDVWLGNVRGNKYARRHLRLHSDDIPFWNHSFEEMGTYDITAEVDYILKRTGQTRLFYVGFSMGGTMIYSMLSEKPHYNNKFRALILLSPVTIPGNRESPVIALLTRSLRDAQYYNVSIQGEFVVPNPIPAEVCVTPLLRHLCINVYSLLNGYNLPNLDKSRLDVWFTHFPDGVSWKTITHFAQNYLLQTFRKFDYGKKVNWKIYGQVQPPEYNLSRVLCPTVVFWGENDQANEPKNVLKYSPRLGNLVALLKVPDRNWGHMDFNNGLYANSLVYQKALKIMSRL